MATKTVAKDHDGYFQPFTDADGNGSAIVRLLPAKPDDEFPFVTLRNHAFKVPPKWFIDNCPTTRGLSCPVCETNTGLPRDVASARKAREYHIANVLVVRDPERPENEGKVMLFKFGAQIMGKINEAITPLFPGIDPINPFDPEEGANLRLLVSNNGGFRSYERSAFESPSAIGDEQMIANILEQCRRLSDIIAPSQFKSYAELKRKLDEVIGVRKAA